MAPYCRPQMQSYLRVRRSRLAAQSPPTIRMMSSVANRRRGNRTIRVLLVKGSVVHSIQEGQGGGRAEKIAILKA